MTIQCLFVFLILSNPKEVKNPADNNPIRPSPVNYSVPCVLKAWQDPVFTELGQIARMPFGAFRYAVRLFVIIYER